MSPWDWQTLCKTVLEAPQYLIWRSEFNDLCEQQATQDQLAGIPITAHMLQGLGQYSAIDQQLNFDPEVDDQTSLCAKRAWEHIPENNATQGSLASIKQGPQEPFIEFIDKLQQAIRRQVNHNQASDILLLQLAFENANKDCQDAVYERSKG